MAQNIEQLGATVYRDFNTDMVPSSGNHWPDKPEIRTLFAAIEERLLVIGDSGFVVQEPDELDALDAEPGDYARVIADPNSPSQNGWWQLLGSDSGGWEFIAPFPDELAQQYAEDAEAAAASVEAVEALVTGIIAGPITPDGAGTDHLANTNSYFWPTSVDDVDRFLTKVEVGTDGANVLELIVAKVEDDATLSAYYSQNLSFPGTGAQVADDLAILVPAGHVVGMRQAAGTTWNYQAGTIPNGESIWFVIGAAPASHTAKGSGTANGLQMRFTLAAEIVAKARIAYDSTVALEAQVGETVEAGWADPIVDTGAQVPGGYTIIPKLAHAPTGGVISRLVIGCDAAGTVKVITVADNGDGTIDLVSQVDVVVADGVNDLALVVDVGAGHYAGVSGGPYMFQNTGNTEGVAVYQTSALPGDDTVYTDGTPHRFEFQLTILTGLEGAVYKANAGAAEGAGLSVLADADATGATDATADFNAALSAHPAPYVRPGVFALTEVPPADAAGLWGPGRPLVDVDRLFLPSRPSILQMLTGARAELMEHVYAGDVLSLWGDSISHFAYATTGRDHWWDRFIRFLNLGIAQDEPIMTALRPSSTYTPAFYGVTTGGTVSTGATGPLGESLTLAANAYIEFTGAYENVQVFYDQQAGAGSLAFRIDGAAAYYTVSAAGATDLDKVTAAPATGEADSALYRITATGGSVTLTGLKRLGVKAAGSGPRIQGARFAHGSYAFGSFSAPRIASGLKQAAHLGGKAVPVIALGINDSFGTNPADIVTNAEVMLDAFEAAGVPRIFAIPPLKPTAAGDGSYTGGRTFEPALGALRRLYRERGVHVFPVDKVDFAGLGLFADGILHPGDAGFDIMARVVLEDLAGV